MGQGYPQDLNATRRGALLGGLSIGMSLLAPMRSRAAPPAMPLPPTLHAAGSDCWWVEAARGEATPDNGGVTAQLALLRDGERLWLIGSGPTPAFGAALAEAARQACGQGVSDVVNTRATPELGLGNSAFPQARLWALPGVMALMNARCRECLARLRSHIGAAGASLDPAAIRPPTLAVGGAGASSGTLGPWAWRAFDRGPGERVLALRHAGQQLVVAQGLLWAGDIPDLRNLRVDALRDSLVALQDWAGSDRIVGEQGGLADAAAIGRHIAYLDALRAAIEPYLARGDLWGAAGGIELPAWAAAPGYAARHALNVQRLWLELEPTIFR